VLTQFLNVIIPENEKYAPIRIPASNSVAPELNECSTTVATLFEAETVHGVLHLLTDDRDVTGAGESELVRGICWLGPITEIEGEGGRS